MATIQQPGPTKDDWERHKEEIRELYLGRGLDRAQVKDRMARYPWFAHVTENIWKKQIHDWHFDVKHHKQSTITVAAVLYQKWLDDGNNGKNFCYAPPGCRPVTEEELKRYMRRKRLVFVKGILVPKTSRPAGRLVAHQPQVLLALEGSPSWQSTPTQPEESPVQQQTLVLQDDSDTRAVVPATRTTADRRRRRHRLELHKMRMAFLIGQRCIKPADLTAPDVHLHHEMVLFTISECVQGSWNARRWSIAENGNYLSERWSQQTELDCTAFDEMIYAADRLHLCGDMRKARKLFHNAIAVMRVALAICLPLAIPKLFYILIHLNSTGRAQFARTVVEYSSALVGGASDAYPGLRLLFQGLSRVPPDTLVQVALQGIGVYSDCLSSLDPQLLDRAVEARAYRIRADPLLDYNDRVESLELLLAEVKSHPIRSITAELSCMYELTNTHYQDEQYQEAEKVGTEMQQMLELHLISGANSDHYLVSTLLYTLALLRWVTGDIAAAIQLTERAISLVPKQQPSLAGNYIETLADWQEELENEEAALAYRKEYDDILDGFANLTFGDEAVDLVDCFSEGEEEPSLVDSSEESAEQDPEVGAQSAWQHYVRGEIDTGARKNTLSEWREEVSSTEQETLTLPVIDSDWNSDDYMVMSWS